MLTPEQLNKIQEAVDSQTVESLLELHKKGDAVTKNSVRKELEKRNQWSYLASLYPNQYNKQDLDRYL